MIIHHKKIIITIIKKVIIDLVQEAIQINNRNNHQKEKKV